MTRPITLFEAADGRRFASEAGAARHERLLEMAEAAHDPQELMANVLFGSPDVQRAVEGGEVEFRFMERLAGWIASEPARTEVGEVLRMIREGIPRSKRDSGRRDGTK
jgi:hypothetical protein